MLKFPKKKESVSLGKEQYIYTAKDKKRIAVVLSAIILLTAIVFSSSINNDFVNWDDNVYVTDNDYIRDFSLSGINDILFSRKANLGGTRFTIFMFALEYKLFGLNPVAFHSVNLLFHLINVSLVFWLIFLLFKRIEVATISALFFAIHPMHVESVAWVSQLKDVLYTFFFLGSLIYYVHYINKDFKKKYLLISFLLFFFSYHSKLTAASLPLLLFLFDFYYKRPFNKRLFLEKILFFLLIAYSPLIRPFIIKPLFLSPSPSISQIIEVPQLIVDFSFFERILLGAYSLTFYIANFFAPFNLHALHPYPEKINGMLPTEYYLAPLLILVLIGLVIWGIVKSGKSRDKLIFGALFFFITISMFSHIIPIKGVVVAADRYTYVPYIGLFCIVGHFYTLAVDNKFAYSSKIKTLLLIVLSGYILAFSVVSWNRNKVWKNGLTLFSDVIAKNPNVEFAYTNRGNAKKVMQDYEGALNDYNKAVELKPNSSFPYNNRGVIEASMKDYDGALKDFNKAIKLFPKYVEAYCNRGHLKKSLGDYKGAIKDYDKAIELKPDFSPAYNDRGTTKNLIRDYNGSIQDFSKATELNPDYWEAYNNRGYSKNILQDYQGAINDFTKAIKLKPDYADAYNNRGNAKNSLQDYSGAIQDLEKALSLKSDHPEAYNNQGMALANLKDYKNSIPYFNRAIELNPSFAEAYNNRAISFANLQDYENAVRDLNKAIELVPNYLDAYNNRGNIKAYHRDFLGSINDFNKVIELNPQNAMAYMNRGNSKFNVNRIKDACEDWNTAAKLGFPQANEMIQKYCTSHPK